MEAIHEQILGYINDIKDVIYKFWEKEKIDYHNFAYVVDLPQFMPL